MQIERPRFSNYQPIALYHGVPTKWHWVVWHPENFKCGQNVDIGAFTAIFAHHGVVIEDDVQIGSHCSIYSLNTIDNTEGKIVIHKGARIGSHCTVLPGVVIGEGSIVGAHSLVKYSVPKFSKVYGVPAHAHLNKNYARRV